MSVEIDGVLAVLLGEAHLDPLRAGGGDVFADKIGLDGKRRIMVDFLDRRQPMVERVDRCDHGLQRWGAKCRGAGIAG